jgi:ABC-2 type transport system ATP-binding protein
VDRGNRMRTGAMMQISSVPATLTVGEHVRLFSAYYPRPLAVAATLRAAGLESLEDRIYGKLSGGQKQRLLFALAVCGDPELLFLDEPTVGLDVSSRRGFWEHIRGLVAQGRTVLLTTHYLEEADALADRVVVIDHGRIVADGTPAEIKRRAAARRLRCRTSLDLETVAELPGVQRVASDGPMLEILTSVAESVLGEMLRRDPRLSDLEVTGAGLEEAFLALTATAAETEKGAA